MVLLIDNYDSFSYNLYQLIGSIQPEVRVVRNDQCSPEEIEAMHPSHIIISPGPGKPSQAGRCEEIIRYFQGRIPILGVCLGHQAICEAYGGSVSYAKELMHGKMSVVTLDRECKLFQGMGMTAKVARYHSLIALKDRMPDCLEVIAWTEDGEVMGVRHREHQVYGLQFHPESILTPEGKLILENFMSAGGDCESAMASDGKVGFAMIRKGICLLNQGEDLTSDMMEQIMDEMMTGEATDAQKGAFLTALAMKGETIEEISAAGKVMHEKCTEFHNERDALEIVGTGGDGSNTFNISTLSAIVASAAGYRVAKHGNRAASSKCGTADCLEALGVKIDADVALSEKLLDEMNLCFLFAQKYHTAMRYVGAVRKEIGVRTLFNILGPISNPAGANKMLLGVYAQELVEPLAHVLANLGVKRAMVVYGTDRMDEISLSAVTKVCELNEGKFSTYEMTPEQFGMRQCNKEDLVGGDPQENARIAKEILDGQEGSRLDAVLLNAGAAIHVADGMLSIKEGIAKAREVIASGMARAQLQRFIQMTNA
ncbi:MAG: anthranilate phosphoribosyltransferase [Lachnospiraceae bacterium]|nr:anthranilate phosphoribosyltransferase [Lachnospiraceae bacterium]